MVYAFHRFVGFFVLLFFFVCTPLRFRCIRDYIHEYLLIALILITLYRNHRWFKRRFLLREVKVIIGNLWNISRRWHMLIHNFLLRILKQILLISAHLFIFILNLGHKLCFDRLWLSCINRLSVITHRSKFDNFDGSCEARIIRVELHTAYIACRHNTGSLISIRELRL